MSQANVRSFEALRDFRAALAVFAEDVLSALGSVDMEVRRTTRWLQDEQRMYWEGEIKRRREKLAMARAELSRKKMSAMFGHSSSHSEQKDLVGEAEKRLRDAEERAQKVKKWIPILQQAALEYQSTTRRLSDLVGGEVPKSMAQLDRLMDALEAYTQVAPPSGARVASAAGGSTWNAGTGGASEAPTEIPVGAEAESKAEAESPEAEPEEPQPQQDA